jgi:hypothetical protein
MYEVTVKQGHPTGVRNRAGMIFTAGGPVLLQEVPQAVRDDPWLIVTEVKEEVKEPEPVVEEEKPRGRRSKSED